MRLQVYVVQNPPDRASADGLDDAVVDRLASQVLAGPVGDVQALGDRFQASQLDYLGSLEGEISCGRPKTEIVQQEFFGKPPCS